MGTDQPIDQPIDLTRTNLISNGRTLSPTFQCPICLDLVLKPVQCSEFSKLFCKDCIKSWLKNSKNCQNKHIFSYKKNLD